MAAHIPGHHNSIADSFLFPEIRTLGPRFGSPSNTGPTVFSLSIQSPPQLDLFQNLFPSLDIMYIGNFISRAYSIQNIQPGTIQTYLAGISLFMGLATDAPRPSVSHSHVTVLIKG